jgi:hypothetical protein
VFIHSQFDPLAKKDLRSSPFSSFLRCELRYFVTSGAQLA